MAGMMEDGLAAGFKDILIFAMSMPAEQALTLAARFRQFHATLASLLPFSVLYHTFECRLASRQMIA